MRRHRRFLPVFAVVVIVFLAWNPGHSSSGPAQQAAASSLTAGRNVNMVSGTTLPDGDPWLQRQNEPSIAVSTRNPRHLLAGANDYRTVDMPTSEGELPGIEGAAAGDAWLGLFKSYDGGESWKTTLHPGFPQDPTSAGAASGLKPYSVAADPVVRAGAAGTFFYAGIAFTRAASPASCVFVSRLVDNNNTESADPIHYQGTTIVQSGNPLQFVDKPWLAVDKPRGSDSFNVYLAYTVFYGTAPTTGGAIMFARSTDGGRTWGAPFKLVEVLNTGKNGVNQGVSIAVDPRDGAVYAAWRNFNKTLKKAAFYVAKSTNGGASFGKPVEVAKELRTFDQATTGITFRTNSYPSMAVDANGVVYLVWSERTGGEKGPATIMLTTSPNGTNWAKPWAVEGGAPGRQVGHQIMPTIVCAMGRLVLVWYDQRGDASGMDTENIDESYSVRRTLDVRMAMGTPGVSPAFEPSTQVSRYLFALNADGTATQVQFNPPNYPLFKGGTAPFLGDYVDVAASPAFVLKNGNWEFNTDATTAPIYHIAWTDNRDVRPPADNNWTNYAPPSSDQGAYGSKPCGPVDRMGMRNQNIYTAKVANLEAGAMANYKTLGSALGFTPSGSRIPRAFVLYVRNPADVVKSFRMSVAAAQDVERATFVEFENVASLDLEIAPFSTAARTLFVTSASPSGSATVLVEEISTPGGGVVSGGLSTSIFLNPDPDNPAIPSTDPLYDTETHNPNIMNPNIMNWGMINPNIMNPNIMNPNIMNPNIMNPNIMNPNIMNPNIMNPNIMNSMIANPNIMNPNIMNPNIMNPNIMNPNIMNPNIMNPNIMNAAVGEAAWTITNTGNTDSSFTFKMFSKKQLPSGVYAQLLAYRVHKVPGILYSTGSGSVQDCRLREEEQHELLLNVPNPNIMNPNIMNPNIMNPNIMNPNIMNTTFSIPPGEEVVAVLRVIDPDAALGSVRLMADGSIFSLDEFIQSVGAATTAHAVNTADAQQGDETPPTDATKLVIATTSLPDGVLNTFFTSALEAAGGTPPYVWALNSGELPPGLILGAGGAVSGTPTAAGLYDFNVEARDASSPTQTDTQRYSIYIDANASPDPLTIMTTSLPGGVKDYWYGATLEATGGTWPRSWSLASGSMPPGLLLDSGGTISGTPAQSGTFNFAVRVTDAAAASVAQALSLTIADTTGTFVTISGMVHDGLGAPLNGVVLRGLPGTPITGASGTSGYYEATVASGWSGTVVPFKVDYDFVAVPLPDSGDHRAYVNLTASRSNQDYSGTSVATPPTVRFDSVSASDLEGSGSSRTVYLMLVLSSPIDQAATVSYSVTGGTATGGGVDYTLSPGTATIPAHSAIGDIPIIVVGDGVHEPDETIIVTISDPVNAVLGPNAVFTYTIRDDDVAGSHAISGTVFYSTTGLSGVAVDLLDAPSHVLDSTATSGTGLYTFSAVADGTYQVRVTAPGPEYVGSITSTNVAVAGGDVTRNIDLPKKLALSFPANGASIWELRPTLGWTTNPEAVRYTIQVMTVSPWSTVETGATLTTSYTLTHDLAVGTQYTWRVGAYDAANHNVGEAIPAFGFSVIAPPSHTITASAGPNGSISPSGAVTVAHGGAQTFTFTPAGDYHVEAVTADGVAQDPVPLSFTFTNVTADHTISVSFAINTYTITATAGPNGIISPSGAVTVAHGSSQTFSITPDPGYYTVAVLVDGAALTPVPASYTFGSVSSDHTIAASFAPVVYTVSGRVLVGAAGVESASLSGFPGPVTTNATGAYTATVPSGWSGTAVPAKTGYLFTPASKTYTSVIANLSGENYATLVQEEKVERYNNTAMNSTDEAKAMTADSAGNIYVTGGTYNGTTGFDFVTIKYDANLNKFWEAVYNGPANSDDIPSAIAVDAAGYVYVTGASMSGTMTNRDYATIRYSPTGQITWTGPLFHNGAARYNGPGNGDDYPSAIAVDSSGNCSVTGWSLGDTSGYDYATLKYNADGTPVWAAAGGVMRYNSPINGLDAARAIALDASGNVYVTGESAGSAFQPDFCTIEYNATSGIPIWTAPARYNGPADSSDVAKSIAVDAFYVYVTGYSRGVDGSLDFATLKYNKNTGSTIWTGAGFHSGAVRYNGPAAGEDTASVVKTLSNGNIYVGGRSSGSGSNYDFVVVKYRGDGTTAWSGPDIVNGAVRYNGPANAYDELIGMIVYSDLEIYVTGISSNGSDNDFATVAIDGSGSKVWAMRYHNTAADSPAAMALYVPNVRYVYVVGSSQAVGTGFDFALIKYGYWRQ